MTTITYFQNWFCVKIPAVTYYYCYFKIKAYNYTVLVLTLVANSESTLKLHHRLELSDFKY